jgi:hypothetical protein
MPSALNGGLVQGQMLGLMNKVVPTNLGNLSFGIQVGLGGFSNLNTMGQLNPLQLLQAMQTWRTLASLGVCQVGQQGGMQNIFHG